MQIEKIQEPDATILQLQGEIDLHAAPTLREGLRDCADLGGRPLLLDFTGVEYIDSSGLAALIEFVRSEDGRQPKVALFGLKKKVRAIFELVRLNELFILSESAEAARAALAAR